jgi:site-specific recombinase XerD
VLTDAQIRVINNRKNGKFYRPNTKRSFELLPITKKWIEEFFISGHKKGMTVDFSENTKQVYCGDFDKFFGFVKKEVTEVSKEDIKNYYRWLKTQDYSKITLAKFMFSIKGLFRFLKQENVIDESPFKDIPLDFRKEKHNKFLEISKQILTRDEVNRLLTSFRNPRDACLFAIMYGLGLRISEALNLKIYDVDLERGKVTIYGKGGRKRELDLKSCLIKRIKLWLMVRGDANTDKLFTSVRRNELSDWVVRRILWKKCVKLGISKKTKVCDECKIRLTKIEDYRRQVEEIEQEMKMAQKRKRFKKKIRRKKQIIDILKEEFDFCKICDWHKRISPHSLRHTFVTHAIEDNIPLPEVSFICGHARLSMTMHYLQIAQMEKSYLNKFRDF